VNKAVHQSPKSYLVGVSFVQLIKKTT